MIDYKTYSLMRDPIINKKTGTVVKWYKNKTAPNETVKEVLVGPHNNTSKIARSWLFMDKNQPKKLITSDFSIGAVTEKIYTKLNDGWKQIKSTIKQ